MELLYHRDVSVTPKASRGFYSVSVGAAGMLDSDSPAARSPPGLGADSLLEVHGPYAAPEGAGDKHMVFAVIAQVVDQRIG